MDYADDCAMASSAGIAQHDVCSVIEISLDSPFHPRYPAPPLRCASLIKFLPLSTAIDVNCLVYCFTGIIVLARNEIERETSTDGENNQLLYDMLPALWSFNTVSFTWKIVQDLQCSWVLLDQQGGLVLAAIITLESLCFVVVFITMFNVGLSKLYRYQER